MLNSDLFRKVLSLLTYLSRGLSLELPCLLLMSLCSWVSQKPLDDV